MFYVICLLQRSALHPSEHDHTVNKDCVSISDGTGYWYDHTLCSEPLRFICQVCANGLASPDCTNAQGIELTYMFFYNSTFILLYIYIYVYIPLYFYTIS